MESSEHHLVHDASSDRVKRTIVTSGLVQHMLQFCVAYDAKLSFVGCI